MKGFSKASRLMKKSFFFHQAYIIQSLEFLNSIKPPSKIYRWHAVWRG